MPASSSADAMEKGESASSPPSIGEPEDGDGGGGCGGGRSRESEPKEGAPAAATDVLEDDSIEKGGESSSSASPAGDEGAAAASSVKRQEEEEEEEEEDEDDDREPEHDSEEKVDGEEECHKSNDEPEDTEKKKSTTPKNPSERREYAYVVATGLCMAFSAGYSNGVALSGFMQVSGTAVKQTVTGVTGAYTNSAIAAIESDLSSYGFQVGTLFSVMAGSCVTSILNPRPVAFELSPRYAPAFLLGSLFMALGAASAVHNSRREFYFTAVGNGIQNACSSLYSANLIRTTHLTGTTTDIGLFVGQFLRGNRTNDWKLYVLSGLATSFWCGSVGGYAASRSWRQHALIFNAAFFFIIGLSLIVYFVVVHGVSIWEAIFGLGKWGTRFEKIEVRAKNDDGDGGEGEDLLSEEELMELFDEIDDELDGHVNQDRLMEALLSKSLRVKKKRRPLVEIARAVFAEMDEGDWTVTREDWRDLVRESGTTTWTGTKADESSAKKVSSGESTLRSRRRRSSEGRHGGASIHGQRSVGNGPDALREASIAQMEGAGYRSVVRR